MVNKFFFILSSILSVSCGIIGEDAAVVPAYIAIDTFYFETDDITQGSNSQDFKDMWISNKGLPLGAIGIPTLIPVQASGNTEIRIDAGVINTGQNNERINYPLMATFVETRNLIPGKIDTFTPVFKYLQNIEMAFIEDYDRVGTNFIINPTYYLPGDTVMKVADTRLGRSASNSGKVILAPQHQLLQLIAGGPRDAQNNYEGYALSSPGGPVFLEIDYNSNLPVDIGYYYIDPITQLTSRLNSVVQTFPTSGQWKKLYIDLTDEVASKRAGTRFIFYIGVLNFENSTPEIFLDDIKLIYLK